MIINREVRGQDAQGSGEWLASRGRRKHMGVDFVCDVDESVPTDVKGKVTKIGFPYSPKDKFKGHLRYVEVTTELKQRVRYFYIRPTVSVGDMVDIGDEIGVSQDLTKIYPGITQHIHLEIIAYVNPLEFFKV